MYCFPPFPGLYNGRVFIDGKLAQDGYLVTAKIGDIKWASAVVSGGRYSMNIPDYLPTEPPCFSAGTIVFELDGMTCTASASAEWASGGPYDVDLTCTPPAPTATSTPAATATVPPTATPTAKPSASPTATPAKLPPSGAGGFAGPSSGLPLWAMALAGWAGLTIVAGLGTLVAAKRR
jgi:hypothetical protein